MSEWREYKLGEVLRIKYGKDHKALKDGIYPVYGSGGIMRYAENYLYDKESILIPRKGSLNNIFYQDKAFWTVDTMFWSEIDKTKVFPKFLFYQLTLVDFENLNVGSAVPSLTIPIINEISISLPPLPEQQRIASILSSLDDKIDLLHRENKTLEAMAETLFRQWFIEEAKEDWKEGVISDFAEHYKKSITPQKYPAELFSHYSIPAYDNNKNPTNEMGNEIHSNKYVVPARCILFSKLNPHKDKRVWLILDDKQDNAICSTEFQIIYPKHSEYLYFLYGWLINKENYEEISSGVGGTSGSHQRIDPKSIFSFNCPNIDLEVIQKYNKIVEPLYIKLTINQQQIRLLTQQRDSLLPKLMSGEIKV